MVGADGVAATDFTSVALRWLRTVSVFLTTYAPQVDAGRYPGDDATVDVQSSVDQFRHPQQAGHILGALATQSRKDPLKIAQQAVQGRPTFDIEGPSPQVGRNAPRCVGVESCHRLTTWSVQPPQSVRKRELQMLSPKGRDLAIHHQDHSAWATPTGQVRPVPR
ncbi:hypothetical protein [Actinomadura coerulea]|uniref:imine reductase family protein n=1 Tax=Actinomadura coerulea TaxID=46159 RepID=UPI00343C2A73